MEEYDDYTKNELAIAINAEKRGRLVRAIVIERKKASPDSERIKEMRQELVRLHREQYEVYTGNKEERERLLREFRCDKD